MEQRTAVGNSVFAGEVVDADAGVEMAHFDILPIALKRLLWESPVKYSAQQIIVEAIPDLRAAGVPPYHWTAVIVRVIEDSTRQELREFATKYRAENDAHLPHVAARATTMRYEDALRFGRKRGRLNKPRKPS